jgi:hypothetical protein
MISSSGAGRPGARLPPGCVSGHHATDAIDAACGMGGGAVLHGRPAGTWAAGPGPATRYRQGRHQARRTRPPASSLRWSSPATRCPACVSAVPGSAVGTTTAGARRGRTAGARGGGFRPVAGGGLRAARARAPRSARARHTARRGRAAARSARCRRRWPWPAGQGTRSISSRPGDRGHGSGTVRRPISAGTGHVLTTHPVNRPAGGSTVIGTCTGAPSCLCGSSPRAAAPAGERPAHDRGDLRHDQRPWLADMTRPRARRVAPRGCAPAQARRTRPLPCRSRSASRPRASDCFSGLR